MIDTGLAPSALRMPNSEVRSVTVTSMMLLTPTMPASSVPQADDPDEDVDACENHHEILVGFHRIVEPDGAFVVGGEMVLGGKAPDDALFELLHRLGGVDALDGDDGIVHFGAVGVVEQLPVVSGM